MRTTHRSHIACARSPLRTYSTACSLRITTNYVNDTYRRRGTLTSSRRITLISRHHNTGDALLTAEIDGRQCAIVFECTSQRNRALSANAVACTAQQQRRCSITTYNHQKHQPGRACGRHTGHTSHVHGHPYEHKAQRVH